MKGWRVFRKLSLSTNAIRADESPYRVVRKDETGKLFQTKEKTMKIIVVNSLPEDHQQKIDEAMKKYCFQRSPWKIVSISTTTINIDGKIGLATAIALNSSSQWDY